VQVQSGLELADHEVIVGISLDSLDGEASDPGADLAREHFRLGVAGLQVERLLAVEGQDLGGRQRVASVEDGQGGVFVGDVGGLLPGELDGVVDNVVHGEVAHTEGGREDGAAESASTGDGLVLVEGEGERLAEEFADRLLDGGDTSAATNHLDAVDILGLELGLRKRLLQGHVEAVQEGPDHLLQLLTLDEGANVNIVHQRLDVHGRRRVGR